MEETRLIAKQKPLTLLAQCERQRWYFSCDRLYTASILTKTEDFSMTMYQFQCVAPAALMFFVGAVAYWRTFGFWG